MISQVNVIHGVNNSLTLEWQEFQGCSKKSRISSVIVLYAQLTTPNGSIVDNHKFSSISVYHRAMLWVTLRSLSVLPVTCFTLQCVGKRFVRVKHFD